MMQGIHHVGMSVETVGKGIITHNAKQVKSKVTLTGHQMHGITVKID